jgi:hypothetical protein
MRKFIGFIACLLVLASCRISHSLPTPSIPLPTPDTTALPTFPAEALYVLGAQILHL